MTATEHRPAPEPPQPNTVATEPATVAATQDDYAHRGGTTAPHPSSYGATPHTYGRR